MINDKIYLHNKINESPKNIKITGLISESVAAFKG